MGEVTEVGRTPHVPVVDDQARRDRKKNERKTPPPPSPDDRAPDPPDPIHGRIDILASARATHPLSA